LGFATTQPSGECAPDSFRYPSFPVSATSDALRMPLKTQQALESALSIVLRYSRRKPPLTDALDYDKGRSGGTDCSTTGRTGFGLAALLLQWAFPELVTTAELAKLQYLVRPIIETTKSNSSRTIVLKAYSFALVDANRRRLLVYTWLGGLDVVWLSSQAPERVRKLRSC